MRPFIRTYIDKRDHNLNDWQAIVKQALDADVKAVKQAPLLVRESDTHCLRSHRLLPNEKKDYKDQKNSKAKKSNLSTRNSGSEKGSQLSQALGRSSKKNF